MKYKVRLALILAIIGGVWLAIGYVNPYDGNIFLSELILQLSGSRGDIPFGVSMPELLALIMRMLPNFIFEIYFGTVLYQHFCTASTYVFSRYPKRINWYFKETLTLGIIVCFYQIVLLSTTIFITLLRYDLHIDRAGIILLFYHFFIHTLWIYCITLAINLLAIKKESGLAFVLAMAAQTICITLLSCVNLINNNLDNAFLKTFLRINPIAHLILGWHDSDMKSVKQVLNPPYSGLLLNNSIMYFILSYAIVVLFGALVVKKHDLLISNMEEGAI